ncbi:glycosyltransferase family 2 protein [Candidatus Oscillochloris fontis]|uniref:glycosyltransferase family 2 protein n=1 Tax=Candidatus Oscillochloris fontis TaxID=2496868 RepID=UPI00101B9523|nr:glycosyltransferase family 2 protein [Candidatus Oscillochloris fontis]
MYLPFFLSISSATILLLIAADIQRLQRVPQLSSPHIPDHAPPISILIPARNEERNIGCCVRSALAQNYPRLEVIVLDDSSTDRTGALLASIDDPRLRVITGSDLPPGWVGKCHACQQLGSVAQGEWLLFLDADTLAAPDLVATLLSSAQARYLDLLTIFPFLELGSFWERVVLPPFLALITALFPFAEMDRPDTRPDQVLANGQCIFVRHTMYAQIGGHAAVRNEVLEDVRLAQTIRAAGGKVGAAAGMDVLQVRMYTNGREVAEGLMKNAAAGYRSGGGRSGWAMIGLVVEAFGPPAILGAGVYGLKRGETEVAWAGLLGGGLSLLASLALRATLYRRLYRQPMAYALLWPCGLLSYIVIAGVGMWRVRHGHGVVWKGRRYEG